MLNGYLRPGLDLMETIFVVASAPDIIIVIWDRPQKGEGIAYSVEVLKFVDRRRLATANSSSERMEGRAMKVRTFETFH